MIITVYRPPSCGEDMFSDCINTISKWLKIIVSNIRKTPKIFLNGDFNFPTMLDWDEVITNKFLDTLMSSYNSGRPLSVLNKQIKILYDFTEEWILSQKNT